MRSWQALIKARYPTTLVTMCLLVGFGAHAALYDSAGVSASAGLQPVLLAQTRIAPPEATGGTGGAGAQPATPAAQPGPADGTGAAPELDRPKGMVANDPPPSVTSKRLTTKAATPAKKPKPPLKNRARAAPKSKGAALPAPKKPAAAANAAKSLAAAGVAVPATSPAATPAHRVTVRFGNHAEFVRVVFDWDGVTDYSLRRDDNSLLLSFNRNAVVDLPSVYAALPQAIGVFEAGEENGNLVVAFSIPNNARYRDSRIGHLVIIDLLVPPNSQPTRPRGRLLPPPTVEPKLQARSTPLPALPLAAKKESAAGAKESPAAVGADTRPPAVVAEPAANPLLPAASSPLPTTPPSQSEQPTVTVPVFAVESTNARSLRFAFPGETGLAAFQRGSDLYVIFDRRALFDFSALGKGGEPNWQTPVRLEPNSETNGRGMAEQPLAQASNPPALGSGAAGGFGATRRPPAGMPEALALDSGSGIRLLVPAGWQVQVSQPLYDNPTGRGAGMTPNLSPGIPAQKIHYWAVDFVKKPLRYSDLRVTNQSAAEAASSERRPRLAISIATKGAKTVIPVTIPELDRPLQVIPQAMVARGLVSQRHYPQFILSSSWQGLVVETLSDGVRIAAKDDQITIEASNGAVVKLESLPVGELFDFAKWATKDSSYIGERQRLQQLVAESIGRERSLNRFNLAYFFLANNHAADALGELNLLSRTANEPNLTNDPAVVAMRGVARVLMNNGKKATTDLNDKRLDGIPAIGWWRGAALALENDWKAADSQLVNAGPLPQKYPIEIRALLLQLAAESAFESGSSERSKNLLFGFPAESKNQTLKDQVDYLKARILLASNSPVNDKQAMAIFDRLVSEGRDWGRSYGEWGRIQYLLKMGQLPVDQAIIRLERLQYAWPGSDLQYRTLVQLGDLYFDQLQPRIGLKRLRQAALYFPFAPDRESVKQHLIDRFVGLYTNKDSERIPPLAALAVYDDNRDLTPASERGDLMIQKLADRLVSIDLLDRAADLLSYQIRQRLTGAERARVGARLAAIQLLDKRPEEALVSLDLSESPDSSPEVADERRLLQAQALFKSGKSEQALRLLDGMTDRDADLQRAEILSAGQQWVRLAGVLARLVGRAEPGVQLNESQQQMVVNLAVALVMAGDNGSVRKLHSDFLGSMPDGQRKNAFIMLTAGDGAIGGTDVAALNQRFAELEQFNQAMRSFARLEPPAKAKK